MSDSCVKCELVVTDQSLTLKCAACQDVFHAECLGKSADEVKTQRTKRSNKWTCKKCKAESSSVKSKPNVEDSDPATVMDMLKMMRQESKVMRDESNSRFDVIEERIGSVKKTVEEFGERVKAIEDENVRLKEELERQDGTIGLLQRTVYNLERDMRTMQQYSRRNNIEIKNIPTSSRENVYIILESIAKALNIDYHRMDFSTAHRVPSQTAKYPPIIAAFVSRTTREMWMSAARAKRLTTSDIFPQMTTAEPVYINAHLTGFNKGLLGHAKQLVRDHKIFAAWATQEGKVIIKVAEKGPRREVLSDSDINRYIQ